MKSLFTNIKYGFLFILITHLTNINDGFALTFNVTSNANTGLGTLRQAITDINASADPGPHIINFSGMTNTVAGQTISLTANLPVLTKTTTIDGYTAPGYTAGTPTLYILGNNYAFLFNNTGANGSVVRGIIIRRTTSYGIELNGVANITIEGCWLGLTETGAIPANPTSNRINNHGILVYNCNNVKIGGDALTTRNIFGGILASAISIEQGSTNITVSGNYIGLNPAGNAIRANSSHGINIVNSSTINIGGTTNIDRNVISGNTGSGINLDGVSSINIMGNYIGTRANGDAAIANNSHGINVINSSTIVIGGLTISHRNVISGNNANGINVITNSHGTSIKGNYIGIAAAGNTAVANRYHGIFISFSNNCIIGGPNSIERNVISGNGDAVEENGISIENCGGHTIQGNFIGTNAAGLAAIRNYDTGLSMTNSSGNTIGGTTFMERNVISGNGTAGGRFGIFMSNVDNTTFSGNFIGLDSTGSAALGNVSAGVSGQDGNDLNIWRNNVISGNGTAGLNLNATYNNEFYGNYIGLGMNGITAIGNTTHGLQFGGESSNNTIGGDGAANRNIISGNGGHGIMGEWYIQNNTIRNNYIGTDVSGKLGRGNAEVGILFFHNSHNNNISNNLISSNGREGIRLQICNGTIIRGNIIGLDIDRILTTEFSNGSHGITMQTYAYLAQTTSDNIIGGTGIGQANIIANNSGHGVHFLYEGGTHSRRNPIIGNSIYCNADLGINFNITSPNLQEGITTPTITAPRSTAMLAGTATGGNTIHVYSNTTSGAGCDCEGETYIGSTTVAAGGAWSYDISALGFSQAQVDAMTVTQTNPTNSTSRFSACLAAPLPVTYISFTGKINKNGILLNWKTSLEKNNKHFEIEKSKDGKNYTLIGDVEGNGNSSTISNYEFLDYDPFEGLNFYRLKQIDYDGAYQYSGIVRVNSIYKEKELELWPNPNQGILNMGFASLSDSQYEVTIYDITGSEVFNNFIQASGSKIIEHIDISSLLPSIYTVKITGEEKILVSKIIKQ